MPIQSAVYPTDGETRTFPSTKHIATKQHCAVRLKRTIDNTWELIEPELYTLSQNAIVFINAPETYLYSDVEVRVADNYDELEASIDDITSLAGYLDELQICADNIDAIIAAGNGIYLTTELPTTSSCGDLTVNTLDGGIYEWDCTLVPPAWKLVAQSSGTSGGGGITPLGVNIVTGLPTIGENGEIIFNSGDGYFYGYINGAWTQMISTPTTNDTVGIGLFTTEPTIDNYEGRVIFNTTTNKLMKYTGGAWIQVVEPTTAAATVADGSLTTAAFAATIVPAELFTTLPTTGNFVGRLVFNTTDGQLYRYTATGFVNSVPTTALTGTITSTQIGANQITTGNLAVGAVTADTIAANAITSDKITANSITTGMIQAGAIGATQIATNAITADKVNAGAITAGKIAALSIDATKIIAGSIGADQLAANSITAGKIVAGAISASHIAAKTITANQIATGTISANELAAYSVTASKIQTGAITVDKISSGAAAGTYGTFSLGATALAGFPCVEAIQCNGVSNSWGLLVTTVGAQPAVGFATTNTNQYAAAFYSSTDTNYNVHPMFAGFCIKSTQVAYLYNAVSGKGAAIGTAGHGVYSYGAYGPFTGSHDALTSKAEQLIVGDIVVDTDFAILLSVNDAITKITTSTTPRDKRVIGVLSYVESKTPPAAMSKTIKGSNHEPISILDPKYTTLMELNNISQVNSVGEGGINVCSEGGNISIGDYICSSSVRGKGMKQDDDLLHNYTVAKARENVDWSKETLTTKMIACTYHCG